jgi:hypothetical protein
MIKTFSKESDAGVKNYITPNGLRRLKDELRFLLTRAAASQDCRPLSYSRR